MTQHELARFAAFIGQPVAVARKIVAREDRERQAHGNDDVHDGFNYRLQQWCLCDYCEAHS